MRIFLAASNSRQSEVTVALGLITKIAKDLRLEADFEVSSWFSTMPSDLQLMPHGTGYIEYRVPDGYEIIIIIADSSEYSNGQIADKTASRITVDLFTAQLKAIEQARIHAPTLKIILFSADNGWHNSELLVNRDFFDSIIFYNGNYDFSSKFQESLVPLIRHVKLTRLVDKLSSLTIAESIKLKNLLEEHWGVTAATGGGMMMMMAAAAPVEP